MSLKDVRKSKHYSTSELARALMVAPEQVSRWERGHVPRAETRRKIAEFFDVDPNDIWPVGQDKETK